MKDVYDRSRAFIKTGDVVYFRNGKTIGSKLTQLVTNSTIFHVGIAFWIRDPQYASRLMLLEAHAGGRRIVSLSAYKGHEMEVFSLPTCWDSLCNDLLDNTGSVPYGYLDYIGIGVSELFGLKHLIRNLKGEVCSELVSRYLVGSGIEVPLLISPGAQYKRIINMGLRPDVTVIL